MLHTLTNTPFDNYVLTAGKTNPKTQFDPSVHVPVPHKLDITSSAKQIWDIYTHLPRITQDKIQKSLL